MRHSRRKIRFAQRRICDDDEPNVSAGRRTMRRRRANGEGSITQLPDGRWMGRVDCGWIDGKRVRRPYFAKTRAEVAQKLSKAIVDRERGMPIAVDRQTVGQYLTRWLEDSAKATVRPSTYISYASY